jgi:hypothetical protein
MSHNNFPSLDIHLLNEKYIVSSPLKERSHVSSTSGTIINSNITIDQTYIDTNPGPYTVEGATEQIPITITLVEGELYINNDTYFIITSSNVTITGTNFSTLIVNNISSYIGLVQNDTSNNNILVQQILIQGENSSLANGAGWICGSYFGENALNNVVQYCTNKLPIGIQCGGIVGAESNVYINNCTNYGELLINPIVIDSSGLHEPSKSGGIYGYNSYVYADSSINKGVINGRICGGIIGETNKNINVINCSNEGNLNYNINGGLIGIVFSNGLEIENTVVITNCKNSGTLGIDDNYFYCSGIISYSTVFTSIKDCSNSGTINSFFGGGIISGFESNLESFISNCSNSGNISGFGSAGIICQSVNSINIDSCINNGSIINNGISGIMTVCEDKVTISNCINNGIIDSKAKYVASGILENGRNSVITNCVNYGNILSDISFGISSCVHLYSEISDCVNYGDIKGTRCCGIINSDPQELVIVSNCKNFGNIYGKKCGGLIIGSCNTIIIDSSNDGNIESSNSGGIVAENCLVNVVNCINSGLINGIGAGGIYGAGCGESVIVENSTNNGEINGINAGGIFGSWCSGTANNCINAGSILGISTGAIFGEFSTGVSNNCVNNALIIGVNSRDTSV